MGKNIQKPGNIPFYPLNIDCKKKKNHPKKEKKWDDCMVEELCQKIKNFNKGLKKKTPKKRRKTLSDEDRQREYFNGLARFKREFKEAVEGKPKKSEKWIKKQFATKCRYDKWNKGEPPPPRNSTPSEEESIVPPGRRNQILNPDHVVDANVGGSLSDMNNLKWMNSRVNYTMGGCMKGYKPSGAKLKANLNCNCDKK